MTLDDALFNWLQIRYVAQQRPEDQSAQETFQFFSQLLDDYNLDKITVIQEAEMTIVTYEKEQVSHQKKFPTEFVHQLLHDIQSEPKYNQSY